MTATREQVAHLSPSDAILTVLGDQGMTAREVSDQLCQLNYLWHSPGRTYARPSYERVHARLKSLHKQRLVAREHSAFGGVVWRRRATAVAT